MTAITGETGAGKTLLVDALVLLLGGRADPALVRAGADEARVEQALLAVDVTPHPEHVRLVPVTRHTEPGGATAATPTLHAGPAMLRGLSLADGVAVVPPGGGARGSGVAVLPLP
jgi:molybdopterin molybdotransferase